MADDDERDDDDEAAAPAPAKSSSTMKLVIIIFVMLLVLGGVGAFVFIKFIMPSLNPPSQTEESSGEKAGEKKGKSKEEKKEVKPEGKFAGEMFELEPFVVNLAASGGRRFLKVTMQLEMSTSSLNEELEKRVPQIRDTVITVLSNKTFDDIYTVHGKFKAREELIRRINTFLESGQIMNVYFTEFVIQ